MITESQIKPDSPVVCSEGGQFATVDHMEGSDTIKLKKDDQGQHHYIPLSWVTKVDDQVHIDRPGDEAMGAWTTTPKSRATTPTERKAGAATEKYEREQPEKSMGERATNEGMPATGMAAGPQSRQAPDLPAN